MPGRELRTLLEGGVFFEGPQWHEGRWRVSDAVLLTTEIDAQHAGLP